MHDFSCSSFSWLYSLIWLLLEPEMALCLLSSLQYRHMVTFITIKFHELQKLYAFLACTRVRIACCLDFDNFLVVHL